MNIGSVYLLFHSRKMLFFQPKFLQKIGRLCRKIGMWETSRKRQTNREIFRQIGRYGVSKTSTCRHTHIIVYCPHKGALDGGSPMSPVDFKKWQCPMSLFKKKYRRFQNSPMSPVDFKKWQCPMSLFFLIFPVDFKIV